MTDGSTRTGATKPSVSLVTCADMPALDVEIEGPLLTGALERAGADVNISVWSDPDVRWSEFDIVVVRGTWDYVWHRDEFVSWAHTVDRLYNPADVLEWNTDKRYLSDLSKAGVPIVPTQFVAPGEPVDLPSVELVVKPAVSMGARDTDLFGETESDRALAHIRSLNTDGRVAMVQPYRQDVDELAETGLIFLNGAFSHGIRKEQMLRGETRYVQGLWRDQVVSGRQPNAKEREVAEAAMDAVPGGRGRLLYARVDLLPGPDGPEILELEATEPSLYLEFGEGSPDRFARMILDRIDR